MKLLILSNFSAENEKMIVCKSFQYKRKYGIRKSGNKKIQNIHTTYLKIIYFSL